jgi:hypothetical protein
MLLKVSVITLLGSALLCASGLNIANPGFENPDISVGTLDNCSGGVTGPIYMYNPTGCGQAWTFEGGSGLTHNPSAFGNPVGPDSSSQSAFLQDFSSFSQTITGINIGGLYSLSFYAIQRDCCDGSFAQTVSVEFDGTALTFNNNANSSVLPATTGWALYTTDSFVAQNASAVLRFSGNYAGHDATAFVDGITSTQATQELGGEAPEPGTWGLLAAGFGGLMWFRRRKQ